jgi:hypothetical protein
MHSYLNTLIAADRAAELRAEAEQYRKFHVTPTHSLFERLRGYFGHGNEVEQPQVRRPERRAVRARARRGGGHVRTTHARIARR